MTDTTGEEAGEKETQTETNDDSGGSDSYDSHRIGDSEGVVAWEANNGEEECERVSEAGGNEPPDEEADSTDEKNGEPSYSEKHEGLTELVHTLSPCCSLSDRGGWVDSGQPHWEHSIIIAYAGYPLTRLDT